MSKTTMSIRMGVGAIALLFCCTTYTLSHAQETPTSAVSGDDEVSDNDDKRARDLYRRGERHYAAGRYEEAAADFLQAYNLSKRASLLFNVANAYERIGDFQSAIDYLEAYLETPEATNEISVKQRIKRLRSNAKERADRDVKIADAARTTPNSPAVQSPSKPSKNGSNALPYTLLGGGLAFIGGGIAAGIISSRAGSDAEDVCSPTGFCPIGAKDSLDKERNFGLVADIAVGSGIALMGIGALLLLTGNEKEQPPKQARGDFRFNFAPRTDGIQVEVRSVF